jgi:hypothetical protein
MTATCAEPVGGLTDSRHTGVTTVLSYPLAVPVFEPPDFCNAPESQAGFYDELAPAIT